MVEVTVKLFAQYRAGYFKVEQRAYPEVVTIKDIIIDTGIPIERYPIGVIMVNGRHLDESHTLTDGDTLSLFPKVGGG